MANNEVEGKAGDDFNKNVTFTTGNEENDNASSSDAEVKKETSEEFKKRSKRRSEAKKCISITRALISFGFETWIALEPGE